MNIDEKNIDIYKKKHIVNFYSRQIYLFEAEKRILSIIKNKLHKSKVLDIGVGGGRTTIHFSENAKSYYGIDYSKEMIKHAKKNTNIITFYIYK